MLDPGDSACSTLRSTGLLQTVITPHPNGLMQEISEGGTGLSGGQRQLVNLTRAFLRRPKVWLLDEPTASMDRALEQRIVQAFKAMLDDQDTLFLVTHKHEMLPLVDRIIVVANKKIVADGPRDAVLERLKNQSVQPQANSEKSTSRWIGSEQVVQMNNLERMQVLPDLANNVVICAHDTFRGEDLSTERSWWSSMVFFLTLGLIGFFLWASLFEIDQTVRSPGEITATARNQIVQVVDGGVLAELFIEEGEKVDQGQRLAVLEKERAEASLEEGRAKVAALRIALIRAGAEARQEPLVFSDADLAYPAFVAAQTELYKQKRRALDESLALLRANLDLARQQLGINEGLYESRDVSLLDVMSSQARVSDANKVLEAENKYLLDAPGGERQARVRSRPRSAASERKTMCSPTPRFGPRWLVL